MNALSQIISQTPLWVFGLFAYFVWRGVKAMKPGDVSLTNLAMLPTVMVLLGVFGLVRTFGLSTVSAGTWFAGVLVGSVIGAALLHGKILVPHRAHGTVWRHADYTVLPLVLIAFATKYAFVIMNVVAHDAMMTPSYRLLEFGLYGLFAGIFVGKFLVYLHAYLSSEAAPTQRAMIAR